MTKNTRYLGLDVHAETTAVESAVGREKARSLGEIKNRPEAVRKLICTCCGTVYVIERVVVLGRSGGGRD